MKTVFALAAAALVLASCGGPKQISVDHGWVRLPVVAGRPAAVYFTLHGGPADATLIDVDSPVAIRSQMHESSQANGMSTMAPLAQVALPAGGTVKFEPGGKHVMLFDLSPSVKPGGKVTLHFTFGDGRELAYEAPAIAANAPVPAN